ncbi:MAG: hypothetical protein RLP02_30940 [Coleofasciculus sp. C2-GNP5-27]
MKTEELAAAITEPAKQVGLEIERELVTQMLHDVEGPGSLPLLQYTLTELWRQRQMNRLTLADYTKLGGVKGTLQKRADQVYESLSKDQQLIAKRIFLELTQLGEGTEDTRRQVFKQEFINDELSQELVEQVMTQLADARLLVTSQLRVRGESGATLTVVDVAHEALIRHWTRLRQWLNENREAMRKERKLEEAANEWESQGKPEERAFLLEGPKLLEAESFLEEYADLGLLSKVAQEFIQVSQAYQKRLRQQEEERQRREQRQTRRTIQVGIVSLIFVTGLAVVATGFGLRSRKQAQIANAKELAATAEWIRSQHPDLYETSILLAVESVERFQKLGERSMEADRALREGLTLPTTVSQVSHENVVNAVAFSPDGKYLATASYDNTARISEVNTGKEVARISHEDWVNAVAFSPDGEYLATASSDNTARVHWRDTQPLVKKACQRLSRNLTASEWQTYIGELDEYRKICPNRPIHPSLPEKKVREGSRLAREGKIQQAIASYTQALEFDPDIDLNPDTEDDKDNEPKAVAHTLAAQAKVEEGEKLARQGKIKEAIASYTQALEFDPDIDLNPDTEDEKDNEPKAVAHQFAAQGKVEEGEKLARQGKIKEAIASYTQAQKLDPTLEISAYSWNNLCWFGSLHQQATQVMNACEKAVTLEPDYKGVRGLARGLTGDTAGAIEDFQAYLELTDDDNDDKAQVQGWINELRAGKNPFTPEELERLLNESM